MVIFSSPEMPTGDLTQGRFARNTIAGRGHKPNGQHLPVRAAEALEGEYIK